MVLPWDLEDWLTDEGDRIVTKKAKSGFQSLSEVERAIYEIWLLDSETRNGGVSQYFANQDRERWDAIVQIASTEIVLALRPFVATVMAVIANADDAYDVAINSPVDFDHVYEQHQIAIVTELRDLVARAT